MNRPCRGIFTVALGACLGFGVLSAAPVLAQPSASQLTPRDLRPDMPDASPPPVLAPQAPESPPSALPEETASLQVTLAEIVVEGGFEELAAATEALIQPFRGRRSQVQELLARLQALLQQPRLKAAWAATQFDLQVLKYRPHFRKTDELRALLPARFYWNLVDSGGR